jgi:uncharacterized protein (TIGR02147 family)
MVLRLIEWCSHVAPVFSPSRPHAPSPRPHPRYARDVKVTYTATEASRSTVCFRSLLQRELARRCRDNPGYSLRAFAKFLDIDHATLSQLLRGRRRLTLETIDRLGERLGLSDGTLEDYRRAQPVVEAAAAGMTSLDVQQLAQDTAKVVTEPHHLVLLELTHLEEFQADSRWIARVLDVSVDEVNMAVSRLARLGMLEMAAPTRWIDRSGDLAAGIDGFASAAMQALVTRLREPSLAASRGMPQSRVHYHWTTFAFDSGQLPAVIALVTRCRTELAALLERSRRRDDVYQLDVCLFPLTTLNHDKEQSRGPTGHPVANPREET